jgi:hypothetical protein
LMVYQNTLAVAGGTSNSGGRFCHFKSADIHLNVPNNSYKRMYI